MPAHAGHGAAIVSGRDYTGVTEQLSMKILLTGACGFIGMHTARKLLERGDEVYGVDNINDYYEVSLKEARLKLLEGMSGFHFERLDIADRAALPAFVKKHAPQRVLHLAAQ